MSKSIFDILDVITSVGAPISTLIFTFLFLVKRPNSKGKESNLPTYGIIISAVLTASSVFFQKQLNAIEAKQNELSRKETDSILNKAKFLSSTLNKSLLLTKEIESNSQTTIRKIDETNLHENSLLNRSEALLHPFYPFKLTLTLSVSVDSLTQKEKAGVTKFLEYLKHHSSLYVPNFSYSRNQPNYHPIFFFEPHIPHEGLNDYPLFATLDSSIVGSLPNYALYIFSSKLDISKPFEPQNAVYTIYPNKGLVGYSYDSNRINISIVYYEGVDNNLNDKSFYSLYEYKKGYIALWDFMEESKCRLYSVTFENGYDFKEKHVVVFSNSLKVKMLADYRTGRLISEQIYYHPINFLDQKPAEEIFRENKKGR